MSGSSYVDVGGLRAEDVQSSGCALSDKVQAAAQAG